MVHSSSNEVCKCWDGEIEDAKFDLPPPILGVKSTSEMADSVRVRSLTRSENAELCTECVTDPVSDCEFDRWRFGTCGDARGSAWHEGVKISVQYFSKELFVGNFSFRIVSVKYEWRSSKKCRYPSILLRTALAAFIAVSRTKRGKTSPRTTELSCKGPKKGRLELVFCMIRMRYKL